MPNENDSLFTNIDLTPDNDDEDLSALDRGNTVDEDDSNEGDDADKDKGAKNDKDNGGAGDGGADSKGKAGKADAGKEGKDGGKGGEKKDEEDDEDDEDDEGEGEGDDDGAGAGNGDGDGDGEDGDGAADKSTPARVKRAQRQRDNERARADALARELAAFKAGQRSAAPKETGPTESETINTDLEKLYEQVENLRADGETKEAARVQRDIDAKNRRLGQIENEVSAGKREAAAAEDRAYNSHLDKLEELFPELQADHDDYDHAKVQRVIRAVNRNVAAGMLPSDAIVDAADLLFGVDLLAKGKAKAAKPKEKEKDAGKAEKEKNDAALVAARKKKAEAASKQPVDSSRRGADAAGDDTKIDINRLSDDDWEKLPESTKAKMRGDYLA